MTELTKQIDSLMNEASEAFAVYGKTSGAERSAFLKLVAEEIENLGDKLIETVMAETALPEGRVRGERGRTTNQILQFAQLVEEGSWVEAIIEKAQPERQPMPKSDIRRMMVPMGPVVVFGAGNFPLAFSVAGGDTASALAGGNPVVVKGHPAHPKTSQLVANAIEAAVKKAGLPKGTFSFVEDEGHETGKLLVEHPTTKAVAFTGSERGGRALYDMAAKRKEPIPVFAEMGSINPVVVLPEALATRPDTLAGQLVASVNLGAGQFCTNPGLIITVKGDGYDTFIQSMATAVKEASPTTMYHDNILINYKSGAVKAFEQIGVSSVGEQVEIESTQAVPAIATVDAATFMENPVLHEEVFGPFSLVVTCDSKAELLSVIKALKGQLTATLHGEATELPANKDVMDAMVDRCGRILFNGVPTGVEVCPAMQHGGPYPACTDSRFTSVGTTAIKRFVRPVSYQDCPDALLPAELQNSNPLNIWRLVDSNQTKDAI